MSCLPSPVSCLLSSDLSSADEVDDLDLVAFAEGGLGPVGAADDGVVEFDGDALAGQ